MKAALFALIAIVAPIAAAPPIPEPLKAWEDWATWDAKHRWCPAPFSDASKHSCVWPSRMGLRVEKTGAQFDVLVTTFHETWVPLPGSRDTWPLEVRVDGAPIAVVEHDGAPAVKLFGGTQRLEGSYRWADIPQRIRVPQQIGILVLVLDGKPVESPTWDAQGFLWLKRDGAAEEADKNFLSAKIHAALEDGIPLWLRTEIELTVSGKSREEDLGTVLPEGWKLAAIESPIPVAVDDAGRMKAQVRAGKWTVQAAAFRFDNPKEIRYAQGAKPAAAEQLVAFRARPDLRIVEITGAPSIDVSQTTFPEKWRELPVYRWDTSAAFHIEERMRGMGEQKPEGLRITRELWLDEDGRALTFRDQISGAMQQLWRLDAAEGQDLGSVRSGGQGQLITRNPQSSAPGVELRSRNVALEATGRMTRAPELPATGWRSDADALSVTLNLPPGWRLFALFGADWVRGDWLTAWTLLDLFLLLIFTLAVFRLWGFVAALLAFIAFGLSFHEPGAPRYLWLIVLVPLALERVVPAGWGRRIVALGKWIAVAAFVLVFVPFVAQQVQQALYPQLERVSAHDFPRFAPAAMNIEGFAAADQAPAAPPPAERSSARKSGDSSLYFSKQAALTDNLAYDSKARIQTGPGVPTWHWRAVSFGWNGPVAAAQRVQPVLIPLAVERALTVLRVVMMLALAGVLLGARRLGGVVFRKGASAAALAFIFTLASASAKASAGGFERETGLQEVLVEAEGRGQGALAHQCERHAIGERPALVLLLLEELPRGLEQRCIHHDALDPSTAEQGRADFERLRVMAAPVQERDDFIEYKARRHQRTRRRQKRAPMRLRRRVVFVARERERDQVAGVDEGGAHLLDVGVVPARSVSRRVIDGMRGQPVQRIVGPRVDRPLLGRSDHHTRAIRKVDARRQFDRVILDHGGDAHARRLPAGRRAINILLRFALLLVLALPARAQFPDKQMLDALRERLIETSDAFPNAADISKVGLTLADRVLTMDAEIHAAVRTAVPLPGRLPAWSPLTVLVDDKPDVALRRDDGFLWLVLEAGVHHVRVEGSLAHVTEWEWTFLLKPHHVTIDAPGWNVTGLKPDGVPEAQVFFALKQKAAAGAATYDRQEVQTIAVVDRSLELGLVWQVRTSVSRLSPAGKAVALRVPLLPGENVLSSNAVVKDGAIEVRLGAQEQSFSWESNLAPVPTLTLATRASDAWVERWHLVASPVWNVAMKNLAPIFEQGSADLVPVWQPWPGESVELAISRPEAIAGATVTVSRAQHTSTLGRRQRVSQLELSVRCSLGEDFLVELPAAAEITSLAQNGKALPVRKDGSKLIIPVRPGEQTIALGWKTNVALDSHARAEDVRLPVESANVQTTIHVPEDRWVLWAQGPRRGPAVRFWGILICSLLAALALGRVARSPLHGVAWMLLAIGLTQVPLACALIVVAWLFVLAWRGSENFQRLGNGAYNTLQIALILLTAVAIGILLTAVGEGLLGTPEMFITGNASSHTELRWFQARSDATLPRPSLCSISIWWYRVAMLAWALWLAAALIHWLGWGWRNFSRGGFFHRKPKAVVAPPPLPAS